LGFICLVNIVNKLSSSNKALRVY